MTQKTQQLLLFCMVGETAYDLICGLSYEVTKAIMLASVARSKDMLL